MNNLRQVLNALCFNLFQYNKNKVIDFSIYTCIASEIANKKNIYYFQTKKAT
jgi:hypothetical protein